MDVNVIVVLVSFALFLAYISGLIYSRTGTPEIVWLLGPLMVPERLESPQVEEGENIS